MEAVNPGHKQTDLIIMDFAKAFDKVPHRRLLHKSGLLFACSRTAVPYIGTYIYSIQDSLTLQEDLTSFWTSRLANKIQNGQMSLYMRVSRKICQRGSNFYNGFFWLMSVRRIQLSL